MSNRVVVTGIGLITPLGVGKVVNWTRIVSGKSGIVSTASLPDYESGGWASIPSKVIGKVPEGSNTEGRWNADEHFDKGEDRRLALFAQYAMVAAKEAISDAGLNLKKEDRNDHIGVAIGSGIGSFQDLYDNASSYHENGYRKVKPLFIPRLLTNMAAGNISIKYGLRGPLHSVSTACATGLHSIGDAYNFINNGYAKVMVAGGTESPIHPLALSGFAKARSVVTEFNEEPSKSSRPFDANRNGFVLGEGCGILILEELQHALDRGLTEKDIYSEIKGYGLSGDAHHITAPQEDGDGAYRAMKMALERSKVDPEEVGYVNAHATSTVIGDRAENNAINKLFASNRNLSISSNKSAIGHLLGAAGSVETAFTVMSLKNGIIPPTLNLENLGGNPNDSQDKFDKFDYVPLQSREKDTSFALCNSFGFGGVNSSICLSKYN